MRGLRRWATRTTGGSLWFLAVCLVSPNTAVAQTGPAQLTLQDALDLAFENNPTFRQAENNRGAAVWAVRNAHAQLFTPSFSSSLGFSYSGAGSQQVLSTDFSQPAPTIGSSYGLSLGYALNGSTIMAPGIQSANLRATEAQIDVTRMLIRNLVVQQYLAVLEAEAQVQLQTQQLERSQENLRLARARLSVGQATGLDINQAEVAQGQAEVGLLQAEHRVRVERLRLGQQIGVGRAGGLETVVLSEDFSVSEPQWELETLLQAAFERNPDVVSLRAREHSASRSEAATKSQWLPSANFSAGWSGFTRQFTNSDFLVDQARSGSVAQQQQCQNQNAINTVAGLPTNDCSVFVFTPAAEAAVINSNSGFPFKYTSQPFSASVSVSLPIFDRFNRNLQVAQASANTDDAMEATRARELQVETEVSEQHLSVIAAYQTIQIQDRNRTSATEQLRLAREQYRVGSGTFFELLDAQIVAQQAEADYVTAVYQYHRAVARLESVVGEQLR